MAIVAVGAAIYVTRVNDKANQHDVYIASAPERQKKNERVHSMQNYRLYLIEEKLKMRHPKENEISGEIEK